MDNDDNKEIETAYDPVEEEDDFISLNYVDEEGKRHESIGYYVPSPDGTTVEERIMKMKEMLEKNSKA